MEIEEDSIVRSPDEAGDPFHLILPSTEPVTRRAALVAARPFLSWALNLAEYRRLYRRARTAPGRSFFARALHTLDVRVEAGPESAALPARGPLIVAANHPHGMLDGIALADLVQRSRPDVRVLVNHLLAGIPDLADLCVFVDPFGGRDAVTRSRSGLRAAVDWLAAGHALIMFPAGEVAHRRVSGRAGDGASPATPTDSPWHETLGRLARRTGAAVVPAYIPGGNREWFYRAGRIHPALRTLLLGRELLAQRGRRLVIAVGTPLSVAARSDRDRRRHGGTEATATVRRAVEELAARAPAGAMAHRSARPSPDPAQAAAADVDALPPDARLLQSGALEVFCTDASRMPGLLPEIGRLREVTFRAVGEGTGRDVDLDGFDALYRHLFVWHAERREVVGAYRLGLTDRIVAVHGMGGLYTSTLFRYDERLLAQLPPAIELGRSFVRAEYQRSSSALLLLWKGIARFVARSGCYRVLFGPVSISRRYGESSQQLLRAFLAQNHYHRELGVLVQALTPPSEIPLPIGVRGRAVSSLGELDALIASLEADGKGIPILLRQYLRLNARLLGFNVDPAFGDVLDALMMVDLAEVDPAILRRYFGRADAGSVLALARDDAGAAAA